MAVAVRAYVWVRVEWTRFAVAVRGHWRRILVGAALGWLVASVGGAVTLAWLEVQGVLGRATSDDLGMVIVLYGLGIGALNAYALRPEHARGRTQRASQQPRGR